MRRRLMDPTSHHLLATHWRETRPELVATWFLRWQFSAPRKSCDRHHMRRDSTNSILCAVPKAPSACKPILRMSVAAGDLESRMRELECFHSMRALPRTWPV